MASKINQNDLATYVLRIIARRRVCSISERELDILLWLYSQPFDPEGDGEDKFYSVSTMQDNISTGRVHILALKDNGLLVVAKRKMDNINRKEAVYALSQKGRDAIAYILGLSKTP